MSKAFNHNLLKILSLFSIVRGYNIAVIILSQFLASIFIMAHDIPVREVLFDANLWIIISASVGAIASGYIINNFYDKEKDLINRPHKTRLDDVVSQNTILSLYFAINFTVILLVSFISFRAVLFFTTYIFSIWLYSHKIKKLPVIGNLTSAFLSVTPFFAILLYFQNYNLFIFVLGFYLFLILSIKELVKDLENIRGDLALNYCTVPVVYGEKSAKLMISALVLINASITIFVMFNYPLGLMKYYFGGSLVLVIMINFLVWRANTSREYRVIHLLVKGLIFMGVLSIALLDPALIINTIF